MYRCPCSQSAVDTHMRHPMLLPFVSRLSGRLAASRLIRSSPSLCRNFSIEEQEHLQEEDVEPDTKKRMTGVLDPDVKKQFEAGMQHWDHPGRRKVGCVELPSYLELAAKRAVSKYLNQQFREDAISVAKRVYHFQLPFETEDLVQKKRLIVEKVIGMEPNVDYDAMNPTEKAYFMEKRKTKIDKLMRNISTSWKDIQYDARDAHVYLGARLAQNYATLKAIFNEIKESYPSFQPKTLFDFGSGIGTTMFAANDIWPNSISEHFNVDICKDMNELSTFLLKGGEDHAPMIYNGVYHREYLPLSSHIKYDLVVAAHTLMELPSRAARIQTIENLWNKTNDLLVIAETGSRDGFHVVLEARNLILQMAGYDVTKSYYNRPVGETNIENYDVNNAPNAHIIAPCPHHYSCPRMDTGGPILCCFSVTYRSFDIGQQTQYYDRERYSYIVIKKGAKPERPVPNWPRINQKVIKNGGFAICRLCCPDGGQKSVTFTKSKHRGHLYRMTRCSDWGDLLPVTVFEEDRPMTEWDKRKRVQRIEKIEQEKREKYLNDYDID